MAEVGVDLPSDSEPAGFRCTCGRWTEIGSGAVCCPECGNRYPETVLAGVGSETVSVDGDQPTPRIFSPGKADANLGRRLGHFKIISRIGTGGMGAVYRALDESLRREVALKVILQTPRDAESAYLDRLFREARAQAGVNHPHVAHVYYVGMEEQTPFLAMELIAGGTLADQMRRGRIEFERIIRYAIQITRALACAADDDIVHGDIKPSNVLLVDEQTVKLSDFGLARRISDSPASSKFSGTPDYMPPEATRGGRADHRGDMYSLGVTLFQLSFGRLPYSAEKDLSVSDQLRLHREAAIEFPERWPAELPEGWKAVLQKLLEKDPARRYQSFVELESELLKLAPLRLTVANPLVRTLAWIMDSGLLAAGLSLIFLSSTLLSAPAESAAAEVAGSLSAAGWGGLAVRFVFGVALLIGVAGLQMRWGNTTGKRFVQLLIVDRHGLKPQRRVLALRSVFQFSWAWWAVIAGPLTYIGLGLFSTALAWLVAATLALEFASIWWRGGASLHDRLLATRVVLDASER